MELRPFRNRRQAGASLGAYLRTLPAVNPLVLGLPRGGVPVAYEVARALQAPLDVFLVRKLGVPGQEELAFGAIADGGVRVLNDEIIKRLGLVQHVIEQVTQQQRQELLRRTRLYRGERPGVAVQGRTIFLIDDGLATGASMRAAIQALSFQKPFEIVPAVPVAPPQAIAELNATARTMADQPAPIPYPYHLVKPPIILLTPSPFWGVGVWYEDFQQVSDAAVAQLLAAHIPPTTR